VTVAATVPVVLQLALVVRHTTTRLVLAPTWNLQSPTTPRPLLLSLWPSNNHHPQTPKVALVKVHVTAMVVLPQLVHSRVPTVEHPQPPSGVATMSGTTFATLVVRRSTLFRHLPFACTKCRYRHIAALARSHGTEIWLILSNYEILFPFHFVYFGLVVYTPAIVAMTL
jgi:hypothetical protein